MSDSIFLRSARAMSAVSINTVREAVRSKVFGSLLFFSVMMILSSLVLGEMSLHNERRVAYDVTLFASTMFAVIMAVYSSITLFYTEIERRTIYTILSKPIPRWQFLVGKYIGVQLLLSIVVLFMFFISAGSIKYQGLEVEFNLILAFYTLYLQLSITTALAHLLATIAAPLLAGFSTMGLFIGGNLFFQLEVIKKILEEKKNPAMHLITALEYTLPNLESLNLSHELTYKIEVSSTYLLQATSYAFTYSVIIMLLAIAVFSRKDLS